MSAPAAKAFSEPVMTMAPTVESFSYIVKASLSSLIKSLHKAFNAFGRFKVINPTFFFSPTCSLLINSNVLFVANRK